MHDLDEMSAPASPTTAVVLYTGCAWGFRLLKHVVIDFFTTFRAVHILQAYRTNSGREAYVGFPSEGRLLGAQRGGADGHHAAVRGDRVPSSQLEDVALRPQKDAPGLNLRGTMLGERKGT